MICKNILLDTDIGPDCDDAGALAVLNRYADRGACRILGIGHCTSNPYGAGAIDAICRFYGRPDVPIGTYQGAGFLDGAEYRKYNQAVTERFPNRYRDRQPEDAVAMYRRILAEQEDKSVDFAAIGPLNNLAALLQSGADERSPLSGMELVRRKVRRLVMMAGIFRCSSPMLCAQAEAVTGMKIEETPEFNVACDIPAARYVAAHWPTPKVYLGFEAGMVETGPSQQENAADNPVALAYALYTENGRRYSWDLFTTEYATAENCPHYRLSAPGTVRFDEKGRTVWTENKAENGRKNPAGEMAAGENAALMGTDYFIELAMPEEEIAREVDALLVG